MLSAAALLLVITVPSLASPAGGTGRCKSAVYYYGVVSTQVVCSWGQAEGGLGSKVCKISAVNELCKDGTETKRYNCDPIVDVYRSADYYNSSIKKETKDGDLYRGYGVPWVLEPQRNPSFYYRARTSNKVQYLYRVNDTGVGPDNCANLVIKVRDWDGPFGLRKVWNKERVTEYTNMTEWQKIQLPLPSIFEGGPNQFYMFTKRVDTLVPDVYVDVTYVLMFEKILMENGSPGSWSAPEEMISKAYWMLKDQNGMDQLLDVQLGTQTLICYYVDARGTFVKTPC